MKGIFSTILFLFVLGSVILAQIPRPDIDYSPSKYVCEKIITKIKIDGKLNEPAWASAEWSNKFVDIEGSKKPMPYLETRMKMLWDDENLYIGAMLKELHINAFLQQRDTVIFYDNDFEIFIDPDGDTHNYYEIELNALNTVWDLLLIKPYRDIAKAAVDDFDIKNFQSAVSLSGTLNNSSDVDSAWFVEVAIPWKTFKSLSVTGLPPSEGDIWKINFSRVEWDYRIIDGKYVKPVDPKTGRPFPENNWVWSPQGVINIHYPEMWGLVYFSEKKKNDGFIFDAEEDHVKWLLRQIYYSENEYFALNGKYTDDLSMLKIDDNLKEIGKLKIEANSIQYLAELTLHNSNEKYRIFNDGLVIKVGEN